MVDIVTGLIGLILAVLFLGVPILALQELPLYIIAGLGLAEMAWSLVEAWLANARRR